MGWNLAELSTHAIVSYIISWSYFFITLPLFTKFFGKVLGSSINYGISWGILLIAIYFLEKWNVQYPFLENKKL
jgi:hypothetical protein